MKREKNRVKDGIKRKNASCVQNELMLRLCCRKNEKGKWKESKRKRREIKKNKKKIGN